MYTIFIKINESIRVGSFQCMALANSHPLVTHDPALGVLQVHYNVRTMSVHVVGTWRLTVSCVPCTYNAYKEWTRRLYCRCQHDSNHGNNIDFNERSYLFYFWRISCVSFERVRTTGKSDNKCLCINTIFIKKSFGRENTIGLYEHVIPKNSG